MTSTVDRWYLTGPLGIGTTTPRAPLHVSGNDAVLNLEGANHAYIQWFPHGLSAGRKAWTGFGNVGDNNLTIANEIQGAHIVLSPTRGNVGIGTTTPQGTLQVRSLTVLSEGATAAGAWSNIGSNAFYDGNWRRVDATSAGVNLHMNADDGAGQEFRFARMEANGTNVRNIGAIGTKVSFIAEGNVGIGTIAPAARLDVAGEAYFRGNIVVGAGGNASIKTRYIDGKQTGADGFDVLCLNWATGKPVVIGSSHLPTLLDMYGDIRLQAGRTISATGRLHVSGEELLYVLNKQGMIVGKEWGGTGNLVVQGRIGVLGQPATPRTPGWGGGIRTWDLEVEGSAWCRNGWQTGPRDLAENFLSEEALEPGEVVCFHAHRESVVRSTRPNDPLVCGVVSTAPGVLLHSDPDADQAEKDRLVPIALSGRVPCRVVDENGPIRRGDLLTSSSTLGHAMRAKAIWVDGQQIYQAGTILGKALTSLEAGTGVVELFVAPA
jgi:hypothetical protein